MAYFSYNIHELNILLPDLQNISNHIHTNFPEKKLVFIKGRPPYGTKKNKCTMKNKQREKTNISSTFAIHVFVPDTTRVTKSDNLQYNTLVRWTHPPLASDILSIIFS